MRPKDLKKPTKPPPPPPLPPPPTLHARHDVSPFQSLLHQSSGFGTGSEYAESVSSFPHSTRSLQPPRTLMPSYNQNISCRSESGYSYDATRSLCPHSCMPNNCCAASLSESQYSYYSCDRSTYNICRFCSHSPCTPLRSCQSQLSASNIHCQCCSSPVECVSQRGFYKPTKPLPRTPSPVENTATTVTPKARIPRPLLSVSPLPVLKNKSNSNDHKNSMKCDRLHYMRFMEHLVVRVFKYIDEREERRKKFEREVQGSDPKEEHNLRQLLMMKESRHLRSQRVPLKPANFEEVSEIGAGYFGVVSLVKLITSEEEETPFYAMKKLEKKKVIQLKMMARVMAEKDILSEADSDWIVRLYYSFQDDAYLYFILEYVPGGDMMSLLMKLEVFSEEMARFYTAEISLALQFVHKMGYVHRDIKPDNILIDAKGHIKLADFGLCTGFRWNHDLSYYETSSIENQTNEPDPVVKANTFEDHPTITKALTQRNIQHSRRRRYVSHVGSLHYMAPEVIKSEACPKEEELERLCDWWSVGIILYEMVVGYLPFMDIDGPKQPLSAEEEELQRRNTEKRILNWRKYFSFPPKPNVHDSQGVYHELSEDTKSLIRGLICDPRDRLCQNGVQDIQNHPFFKGVDWDKVERRCEKAPYIPPPQHELDTVDFGQPNDHRRIASGIGNNSVPFRLNDFTYRTFWLKPQPM